MPEHDKETFETLIGIFEDTITEVISTVSGVSLEKSIIEEKNESNFAGILPFIGDISGIFLIKTNGEHLKILTSYITGIEAESIYDNDMTDCIGELANMVCGLTKSRAARLGIRFNLSTPFSAKGDKSIDFSFKKNSVTSLMTFSSDEILINARVILV